jgi:KDO2-lipid IV(A) lauroyltransferase
LARPLQKFKNDLIYLSARSLIGLLGSMPLALLAPLGSFLGRLGYRMAGGERRKTLENLRTAFPDLGSAERDRIGGDVFAHFGREAFSMVRYRNLPPAGLVELVRSVDGWDRFEKARAKGKGVLVVTAHLGNWEVLSAYFAQRVPVAVVAQKLYDPRFDAMITALRVKWGAKVIQRGTALKGILRALDEGRTIGALCDQDTGLDGVFVPFFGRDAWTQTGVVRVARRTGAPLVPAFITRRKDGRYHIAIEPEMEPPRTGREDRDVRETVRRFTAIIERHVRMHPEQWVWMHPRWKTRPKDHGKQEE